MSPSPRSLNADLNDINLRIVACRRCPRLVAWREQVAETRRRAYRQWEYWVKPVPGFGDEAARVLVVGLAPGAHGANRTGRMFTGDGSGEFLYRLLHRAGFANQPGSTSREDGLRLNDLYISAVCRCAPPANKPAGDEISACLPFLEREIRLLAHLEGIVCLGRIAFDNTLALYRSRGAQLPRLDFAHGAFYRLGDNPPSFSFLSSQPAEHANRQADRGDVRFDLAAGEKLSLNE